MKPWEKYQSGVAVNNNPKPWEKYASGEIQPQPPQQPPTSFLRQLYSEGISPIVAGSSTFAAGIPRLVAKKTGTEEMIYPEQKTLPGKILRGLSEMAGFTAGLPGRGAISTAKLIGKGAEKLPKFVGKALVTKVAKGAGAGAVGMGLAGDTLEDRRSKAMFGATIGGAIPLGIEGGKVVGGFIAKSGRWVAKNIGGITDATVNTIKRLGASRVFDPLKAKADYIVTDLVPRIQQKVEQSIKSFTPQIQKFAKEKLKIPQTAITTIKNKGVDTIQKIRQTYNNSTDAISQRIANGFRKMEQQADDAYVKAVDSFKGKSINSQSFYQSIQRGLRVKGWVDLQGNPTTRYRSGLDPVTDKLTDLYLDMRPVTTGVGKRMVGQIISKEDFFTYRDALNSMLKDRPSDRLVMQAKNALYGSAEKSGMTGLKAARDLEAKVFSMGDKFLDSQGNLKALGKEQNLGRFHKLSQDQIRQLREIEGYVGEKFIDDLDALTAGQYLDDFLKITPKTIATDLIRAKNPNWTKYIKLKFDDLLGEQGFKDAYDDLMAHFANMDFELVSDTPGAGGGFYPSRAGILRSMVGRGVKKYYRDIAPKTEAIKSFTGQAIQRGIKELQK